MPDGAAGTAAGGVDSVFSAAQGEQNSISEDRRLRRKDQAA
jgi:hypothetical protein